MIIDLQSFDTWKIQLITPINFFKTSWRRACNPLNEHNIKFSPYSDVNEAIDELFESLSSRYQGNLKKSMIGSDSVELMYYKCHKVNSKCGGL